MRLSCPLRRAAPERPRVRLRRLCCSLRELPRTTARVGEVADQAVHAVGVAACEREDAAGDVAKLNEADRACVAEPAPAQSAAARSATARLVAKVAVALAGGVRTVAPRVTARIATYIAVSAGVTRREGNAERPRIPAFSRS